MAATIFKHKGDFDGQRRRSLPYSNTKFYAPSAIFFDTTNVTYVGAAAIKTWMLALFLLSTNLLVIDESTETKALYTAIVETMVNYFVKGDPVPISVPRIFVFEIMDSESEDGFDGLQFFDIKLYWDPALLSNEIKRRREEK
ncbi:hypothetical protein V1527DRAFT_478410 [Lipomyces starkeyi]